MRETGTPTQHIPHILHPEMQSMASCFYNLFTRRGNKMVSYKCYFHPNIQPFKESSQ